VRRLEGWLSLATAEAGYLSGEEAGECSDYGTVAVGSQRRMVLRPSDYMPTATL